MKLFILSLALALQLVSVCGLLKPSLYQGTGRKIIIQKVPKASVLSGAADIDPRVVSGLVVTGLKTSVSVFQEQLPNTNPSWPSIVKESAFHALHLAVLSSVKVVELGNFVWGLAGRYFRLQVGLGWVRWHNGEELSVPAPDPGAGPGAGAESTWRLLEAQFPPAGSDSDSDNSRGLLSRVLSSLAVTVPLGRMVLSYALLADAHFGGRLALAAYALAQAVLRAGHCGLTALLREATAEAEAQSQAAPVAPGAGAGAVGFSPVSVVLLGNSTVVSPAAPQEARTEYR